jgi:hypothetical protein
MAKDPEDILPTTLTKEMIDKLKVQLDGMEGAKLDPKGPIVHKPGGDAAWYIAYSTKSGLTGNPGADAIKPDIDIKNPGIPGSK